MNSTYLLLGAMALAIVFVAIMFILRWRKGSIEIIPEKKDYRTGDIIKGKLILKLKKPVKSKNLVIGLRCERIQKTYTEDRKQNIENEDVLFDFNQPLDKEKEYVSGEYSYDFAITIPLNVSQKQKIIVNLSNKSVKALADDISIKWYLYARLDCEGVDLSKDVQINIAEKLELGD
ncbi:MAG: hypothetical protein NTZ83_06285 [Candidatus Pacearchaeota archaeon]|nr:hypothetical protein [Candidatus Pacearchaeota archaeon]